MIMSRKQPDERIADLQDEKSIEYKPTVGQQLALIPDDATVSIYHVNIKYMYYGPVKDVPDYINNLYRVYMIDKDTHIFELLVKES